VCSRANAKRWKAEHRAREAAREMERTARRQRDQAAKREQHLQSTYDVEKIIRMQLARLPGLWQSFLAVENDRQTDGSEDGCCHQYCGKACHKAFPEPGIHGRPVGGKAFNTCDISSPESPAIDQKLDPLAQRDSRGR
jgi:hypothetical protein